MARRGGAVDGSESPGVADEDAGGRAALHARPSADDGDDAMDPAILDDDVDGDDESMRTAVEEAWTDGPASPAAAADGPGPRSEVRQAEAGTAIVDADGGTVVVAVRPPPPPAPATPPAPPPAYYQGLRKRLEPFARMAVPVDPGNPGQIRERFTVIEHFRTENALAEQAGKASDSGALFCRICRDVDEAVGGPGGSLVSPCRCRGSVGQVHVGCLERWLAESDSSGCELCGHRYATVRTPNYNILASIPAWVVHNGSTDLLFDFVAFVIFTPVAFFGTQMGLTSDDNAHFQVTLMAAIDLVYTAWLSMRLHYHAHRWYSWWRRKSTVKVILDTDGIKDQPQES